MLMAVGNLKFLLNRSFCIWSAIAIFFSSIIVSILAWVMRRLSSSFLIVSRSINENEKFNCSAFHAQYFSSFSGASGATVTFLQMSEHEKMLINATSALKSQL